MWDCRPKTGMLFSGWFVNQVLFPSWSIRLGFQWASTRPTDRILKGEYSPNSWDWRVLAQHLDIQMGEYSPNSWDFNARVLAQKAGFQWASTRPTVGILKGEYSPRNPDCWASTRPSQLDE